MCASFGPIPFEHLHLNLAGFGRKHSLGAEIRRAAGRRTFDIKNVAFGCKGRQLFTLYPPHFFLVGTHRKHRDRGGLAKFRNVVGFAIQNPPTDARRHCRFRDLIHGSSNRLNQNRIRTLCLVLDDLH